MLAACAVVTARTASAKPDETAQTDSFKAAAAIAGATDIATHYGAFDPAARGWPGIEQDMAANGPINESGLGFRIDPATDPALYHRNSPLTFADRVHTPLLQIHGELIDWFDLHLKDAGRGK
jgi:dipeptidyl aminopeptidase/acylaminoacyl peptidase